MKLSFFGAAHAVTGSCHCLEVNGRKILIDCGLQQGRDEIDNGALPFHPGSIDFVLITHAHIDHTGRVPMLVKQGFQGRILTVLQQGDTLLPHFDVRIRTAVLFGRIIKKLLDGHHVTMIGDGHSAHTVFHRLVNQARHAGLTVEDGILSMHMKMYEVLHNSYNLVKQKLRAKVTPH